MLIEKVQTKLLTSQMQGLKIEFIMMNTRIFDLTQKIIEDAEAYILNHESQTKIGFWLSQQIIFPFKFLILGSEDLFKPFAKWSVLSFVFLMLGTYFVSKSEFPPEIATFIISICIYVPMGLVIFSVPSTYAYYGVKKKNVEKIYEYLLELNINNVGEVELIEDNLERIYARVVSRVSAYKFIIGASWAFFTLIFNQQMNVALKTAPENILIVLQENMINLALFITFSLLAMWLITSYKRASDLLFKSVEFGFVELKNKMKQDISRHLLNKN